MEHDEIVTETKENGKSPDRRYCYVCEGVTDEDRLKKIGCLFVVITGGKYIRPAILAFLKRVAAVREIVIVTDPDTPGKGIEARIQKEIGGIPVHAMKDKAIRKGKVGIAQMSIEDLKALMKPFVLHDLRVDENLSLEDESFDEIGFSGAGSQAKRRKLIAAYDIPFTSAKAVFEALLILGVTEKEIREVLAND